MSTDRHVFVRQFGRFRAILILRPLPFFNKPFPRWSPRKPKKLPEEYPAWLYDCCIATAEATGEICVLAGMKDGVVNGFAFRPDGVMGELRTIGVVHLSHGTRP